MNRIAMAGMVAVPLLLAGCTGESAEARTESAPVVVTEVSIEDVRRATERYRDVNVALAEGYVPPPMNACESAEHMGLPAELGAMGIHYLRPDLLQLTATEPRVDGTGTHTDFLQPAVLIYEPQADGSLELVAVENLVFKAAWDAAGNRQLPSFNEVQFDYMVDDPATELDEAHMFEPHYDLHVWIYRDNPEGMFAPFNRNVSCAAQPATHQH